ncbi:MAG: XRE family transcriptional regulator [Candidatus Bathyarchaeia archaeon]
MSLKCESVGHLVVPLIKAYIAKELIDNYHFTQVEVAEKLGITQAAVSQYLHQKRGLKGVEKLREFIPSIQNRAHEIAQEIAISKLSLEEISTKICEVCSLILNKYR